MHHGILVDFVRQFGGSLLLPCSSWGLHIVCQALQQYLYPWSHFATPLLEISEISGTFIAMKMPMIQLQTSFPPPCISFFLLFFCSFLWFRVCGKWACLCVFPCARCSCAHGICGAQRTALGCWSLPFTWRPGLFVLCTPGQAGQLASFSSPGPWDRRSTYYCSGLVYVFGIRIWVVRLAG